MDITYKKAQIEDAQLLVHIYNDSFYSDFLRYGECPGYGRTVQQVEQLIRDVPKEIICCDGRPVGILSVEDKGDGCYYLGCLCVIPEYQGRGIGRQSVEHLLAMRPEWKKISLITPADKTENVRFYVKKCGFSIVGNEMDGNVEVTEFQKLR